MYLKRRNGTEELLSKEQLQQDFFVDALSIVQIGKKYRCNTMHIREALKEYDLKLDPEIWYSGASQQQRQLMLSGVTLTDRQRSVVVGSILGDSSLSYKEGNRHALLECSHCEAQRNYLEWFREALRPFVVCDLCRYLATAPGGKRFVSYTFHTIRHPEFTKLRQIWYPEGKKIVPPNIEELLDELALAVWFMDDGHTNKNESNFYTQGFTWEDCQLLLDVLYTKFSLIGKIINDSNCNKPVLQFAKGTQAHYLLHEIIDPLLHSDLSYKRIWFGPGTVKGERHHSAKLTEDDVRRMRELAAEGTSTKELCCIFHMKGPQVHAVVSGTAWKHVKDIDGLEYISLPKIWPRKGSHNAAAKLNEDKVRAIRRKFVEGESCIALANEYGVASTVIRSVVKKQTWKHVEDENGQTYIPPATKVSKPQQGTIISKGITVTKREGGLSIGYVRPTSHSEQAT